ncbi:MAG: hypothetical protein QM532_04415 [Cyanobium sp. MAG06]|nr:hypothetical protein [Cyanobium sp. MAG06]
MTQEKVLNKKIDIITAELEKAKKILEENNNKKSSELDLRKNMEIFDNDNKVNEIKEDVKVFIKENTQQPTESLISNNSDVLEIKNNNQNTSTNEPYQYNTMILAFLDAMLILLIIVIILYIIIN